MEGFIGMFLMDAAYIVLVYIDDKSPNLVLASVMGALNVICAFLLYSQFFHGV